MSDSKFPHNKISRIVRDIPRSGIRDFFDIVNNRKDVVSLGIGEPDFVTPWRIRDAAYRSLDYGKTSYTSNMGSISLRNAVSKYINSKTKITYCPKEEVLITVGVSEGLDLAIRTFIEPGDEVIYHEPSYVSYNPIIKFAHGIPVVIKTKKENNFKITREELESVKSKKTKLLLLNYPNNPTGSTLTKSDIEMIANFAITNDIIVVTDEIYSDLSYEDDHFSIISVPGMRERTIYLHGLSKAWAMTGWRIGFAAGPKLFIESMMKIHQYTMLCAPIMCQEAAREALQNGDEELKRMKNEYLYRRNYIKSSLKKLNIPFIEPKGAFYIFIDISEFGLSSKDFALNFLEKKNVAVVPGTAFGKAGEGFIRCSFATSLNEIKKAMCKFEEYITSLK